MSLMDDWRRKRKPSWEKLYDYECSSGKVLEFNIVSKESLLQFIVEQKFVWSDDNVLNIFNRFIYIFKSKYHQGYCSNHVFITYIHV